MNIMKLYSVSIHLCLKNNTYAYLLIANRSKENYELVVENLVYPLQHFAERKERYHTDFVLIYSINLTKVHIIVVRIRK